MFRSISSLFWGSQNEPNHHSDQQSVNLDESSDSLLRGIQRSPIPQRQPAEPIAPSERQPVQEELEELDQEDLVEEIEDDEESLPDLPPPDAMSTPTQRPQELSSNRALNDVKERLAKMKRMVTRTSKEITAYQGQSGLDENVVYQKTETLIRNKNDLDSLWKNYILSTHGAVKDRQNRDYKEYFRRVEHALDAGETVLRRLYREKGRTGADRSMELQNLRIELETDQQDNQIPPGEMVTTNQFNQPENLQISSAQNHENPPNAQVVNAEVHAPNEKSGSESELSEGRRKNKKSPKSKKPYDHDDETVAAMKQLGFNPTRKNFSADELKMIGTTIDQLRKKAEQQNFVSQIVGEKGKLLLNQRGKPHPKLDAELIMAIKRRGVNPFAFKYSLDEIRLIGEAEEEVRRKRTRSIATEGGNDIDIMSSETVQASDQVQEENLKRQEEQDLLTAIRESKKTEFMPRRQQIQQTSAKGDQDQIGKRMENLENMFKQFLEIQKSTAKSSLDNAAPDFTKPPPTLQQNKSDLSFINNSRRMNSQRFTQFQSQPKLEDGDRERMASARTQYPSSSAQQFSNPDIPYGLTDWSVPTAGKRWVNEDRHFPRAELSKFSGNRINYPLWRSRVVIMIDQKNISNEAKCDLVIQSLEGEALLLGESFLRSGIKADSYHKLIKELDEEYGGEDRMRENQLRRLKDFGQVKDFSYQNLKALYLLFSDARKFLLEFDPNSVSQVKSMVHLLGMDCIPENKRLHFKRWIKDNGLDETFDNLTRWVKREWETVRDLKETSESKFDLSVNKIDRKKKIVNKGATYLDDEVVAEEEEEEETLVGDQKPFKRNTNQVSRPSNSTQPSTGNRAPCCICKKPHNLQDCPEFNRQNQKQRISTVKEKRICFHCLLPGHRVSKCRLFPGRKCGMNGCKGYHHRQLHVDDKTTAFSVEEVIDDAYVDPTEQGDNEEVHTTTNESNSFQEEAHISFNGEHFGIRSALVWVSNGKKAKMIVAALDSCSNNTNISAELAEELELPVLKDNIPRRVNGMRSCVMVNSSAVKLTVSPLDKSQKFEVVAYTVEDFMSGTSVTDWSKAIDGLAHFKNIKTYPKLWRGAKFDLLLGTDYADLMVANESIRGPRGSAVAELTDLGWAFSGPVLPREEIHFTQDDLSNVTTMTTMFTDTNVTERLMERQWDLEALGMKEESPNFSNAVRNKKIPWTPREVAADEKMEITFLPDEKAYQISIPWKGDEPTFKSNLSQVKARQDKVMSNLEKSGTSAEQIYQIFQDYVNKGYVRELSPSEINDPKAFFLPWFPVVDTSRETTKCRVVFDAAAKFRGQSLNSEIESTPNRLNNLYDILIRFRKYKYCVSADISEMFLRVKLDPKDRRYHRFVCGEKYYEWQVMLFGNQCSPNGSQKVLAKTCEDFGEDYPEAVETIVKSMYMDDAIDSRETVKEIVDLVTQLPGLLGNGNMNIQKFYSNCKEAMESIPEEIRSKNIVFRDTDMVYEDNKVLGMAYMGDVGDNLHYTTKFKSKTEWQARKKKMKVHGSWTKRYALSASASVYDPLGLLAPFKIRAQIMIQKLWRCKLDWDAPLSDSFTSQWDSWLDGMFELDKIRVPRWLGISSDNKSRQLHVFVDASTEAFAACVYIRIENQDGEIFTNLVTAKARVTPLKAESISRLELVAGVLGTRLARAVVDILDVDHENWFMWTDSQVCLHWISTPAKAFMAYVANRCGEIQSCTKVSQWHHVPSNQNPADIATRPISIQDLTHSKLWWEGPEFLKKPDSEWPVTKLLRIDPSIKLEERKVKAEENTFLVNSEVLAAYQQELYDPLERIMPENWSVDGKYNGYKKCLKRFYYLLEVIKKWKIRSFDKKDYTIRSPTPEDYNSVRNFLIRRAQLQWFSSFFDGERILEGRIPKDVRKFQPFLDHDNIIRSNSRLSSLQHLELSERFPVLLHRKSGFALLAARYHHFELEHPVGHRSFVAKMSSQFAMIGLGTLCQKVKRDCFECRRLKGKSASQQMANLPDFRLELGCQTFQNVGLDYCGPFLVKVSRGRAKRKVWILVLTCMQVRAVHLEVVTSQDTSSFINALSRFSDVRGIPKLILSDNQTCFRRADKELQEWLSKVDWSELAETTGFGWKGSDGITWKFNPPHAPHFGGIFETVVKATKRGLKTTLEETGLDEEQFRTAVSHVMYLLNGRPITTIGDSDDERPLTPNDFLMAHHAGHILPPLKDGSYTFGQKWQVVQNLVDSFWKRFTKEMIKHLHPRKIWSEAQPNLKVDDIVLEIDPNLPRGQWRLLRIKELLPSFDGLVRRVIVVNSLGKAYERAIHHLIPIVPN